ncbi:MAG: TIGR03619 family F420-dependent LLM class oxidoreductase [Candidatus Rokubacteria bacterium]|nr:TIGR03619 family F420-dependent LLM class oxidoreductase [Candidatus Rokubacteria bacterium]
MKRVRRGASQGQLVEFGFHLPGRGPLARPSILARLARKADALGYACITVSDHVVLPTKSSAPYPYSPTGEFPGGSRQDYLEPLALMAWLLGVTRRIRVGTSVLVVPYRNPVVTAKQLATLDALSGGRVIVGCGVGWWPEEFQALAAPPFAERGAVTDEYLQLMKELWTRDEPRFAGKYYHVSDVTMFPKPAQKPHPPIWIGGHTDRALRRVGELADAWHPIGLRAPARLTPDEYAEKAQQVRAHAARAGRRSDAILLTLRAPLEIWPRQRTRAPAGVQVQGSPLRGPAEKVIRDIRAYTRAGVRFFVFDFTEQDPKAMVETMERFAEEVRPKVARAR